MCSTVDVFSEYEDTDIVVVLTTMGNSNLLTYLIVQGFATNPGGDVQAKALSMLVFFAILFHLSLKVVKTSPLGMFTSRLYSVPS